MKNKIIQYILGSFHGLGIMAFLFRNPLNLVFLVFCFILIIVHLLFNFKRYEFSKDKFNYLYFLIPCLLFIYMHLKFIDIKNESIMILFFSISLDLLFFLRGVINQRDSVNPSW